MVRIVDDAKSAAMLSIPFGIAAAATVPLLLPSLPPEASELPLPLPLFCAILAAQGSVIYGLLGLAGMRLARKRDREPAPQLTSLWTAETWQPSPRGLTLSIVAGLACGALLILAVSAINHFFPGTLPKMLHPPGIVAALLASLAGSFGEEILFRLFLLSLLLWLLPANRWGVAAAILISALAFGAAHAPAFVFLFGGFEDVPLTAWLWLILLNGLCGVTYGVVYLRYGIIGAILAHFATDAVWHAASQIL